jgi:hypothetical protein
MSLKLLSIAIVILATLLVLVFASVALLAALRRHCELETAQVLPQARTQLLDLLNQATAASSEDIHTLSRLPAGV